MFVEGADERGGEESGGGWHCVFVRERERVEALVAVGAVEDEERVLTAMRKKGTKFESKLV